MMSEKLYHLLYYVSAKSNSTQHRIAPHEQHSAVGLAINVRTQTHLNQMNNNDNALL